MIYLNVVLTVKDAAQVDRVKGLLEETARRSATEPGCSRFEVYQSQSDERQFFLVERWETQAHLDAHRAGTTFREFYTPNVLPLVERAPHPSDLVQEGSGIHPTPLLKIYHVPGTRSMRVVWLCEELGLPHEVVTISFSAEYRASAEWRRLNPVGKVPAMQDGDFTMFESGAMVQYLLDRYGNGRLQPRPGTEAHARYLQWSWFAEATLARPIGEIVNHRRAFGEKGQIPAVIDEMKSRVAVCVKALDEALAGRDYLLGADFSAADIMMGYSVMIADRFASLAEFPNVVAYWQRLSARPACRRTLARGQ